MEVFCNKLPKIELHAHLNGSLSEETLKTLGSLDNGVKEYQKLVQTLHNKQRTLNECFKLFKVAHNLTSNKKNLYHATQLVIEDFYKENVIYLELRTTPKVGTDMNKRDYIETVINAILNNKYKDVILVKLLLSIDRSHDIKESEESLNIIIEMKHKYPSIITGIDLCGNPNIGSFNHDLFKKAKTNGLFITLHCGEVKNDDEVIKMLEFNPNRLGHGTCLHPNSGGSNAIWDLYRNLQLPVEICLTSNVTCGTIKSYEQHHITEWLKNNLPFSICTDDKGVFCTNLSKEYYIASKYFKLNKKQIYQINFDSINYIFATDSEKQILKLQLEKWKELEENFL